MFIVANHNPSVDDFLDFHAIYPAYANYWSDFAQLLTNLLNLRGIRTSTIIVSFVPHPIGDAFKFLQRDNQVVVNTILDKNAFTSLTLLKQRELIATLVVQALLPLYPAQATILEWIRLYFSCEQAALSLPLAFGSINLPVLLLEDLSYPNWQSLSCAAKDSVVSNVHALLVAKRGHLSRYLLSKHSIQARDIYIFHEETSGVTFSLIAGTTFQPGYDEERIAQLEMLFHHFLVDYEGFDRQELFSALRQRGVPVVVNPILLATEPIVDSGQTFLMAYDPFKIILSPNLPRDGPMPISTDFPILVQLLEKLQWSIPSTAEYEWAMSGGSKDLFYWGNQPNDLMVAYHGNIACPFDGSIQANTTELIEPALIPVDNPSFPEWNQFGIRKAGSHCCWCEPDWTDSSYRMPLLTKGGGAGQWQKSNEWLYFLSAFVQRHSLNGDVGFPPQACIRPAIRLVTS